MTIDQSPASETLSGWRRIAYDLWPVPAPGTDRWQPALLKVPRGLHRAIGDWMPVLVRGHRSTVVGLLGIFLAFQFLIPARLVISGMGAVGRPSVAVGIMFAFVWFVSAIRPGQLPPQRQPVRWIVALYISLQLLGYAVGYDRLPSAGEASSADRWLIFTVSIAGVVLIVADGIRTREDLDRILRLLVAFSAVMSIVGALQFFRIIDLTRYIVIPGLQKNSQLIGVGARGDEHFARVAGTANHYIEFGVVLALVLPIAIHYALFSPPGRTRIWRWILAGIVAFGIPLSISRSAVLTVAMTMFLLAVIWPWRQRYNALMIGALSLAVFHAVNRGVLGTIKSLFLNAENDTSVTDRIARTTYVIDLWSTRPWLGRGAGMITPEAYILLDNQWYMTLLAGGVVGVVGLALFFLVPYLMGRGVRLRGQDQETRHLGQALAVTMPAAVMSSGTFDSFSFPTWVGVVCLLIGAIGALWRLDGTRVSRPLQVANPKDRFVTTPLTARLRARIKDAWFDAAPKSYGRSRRQALTAVGSIPDDSRRKS